MIKGDHLDIKKNYIFSVVYQLLNMLLPLLTVPYVSRVLQPEGVGTYAYTDSIAQYFILIGMLGIGMYGNRMTAIVREDKKKLSQTFFSIYLLQLTLSIVSLAGYLIFIYFFMNEYKIIAFWQVIALLGSAIDCSWLFHGLEQFKKIVIRNIVVKIAGLLAIFTFVKNHDDLVLYTIIMGLSSFMGQLIMWFYVRNYVEKVTINIHSILHHVKPTFVYFLPEIAWQVYFVINKTLLGVFSNTAEVGIYDYADKIMKVALAVITSLGIVMLPRMANMWQHGDIEKAKIFMIKSLQFSTLIAVGIAFGLAGTAKEFIPWYLGGEFIGSIDVLIILSPAVLIMAWSNVFGSLYLVPLGKMKVYTISLYIGLMTNLILNYLLIKNHGGLGAAISTLCAELAVTSFQLFFVRNLLNFKRLVPKTIYYLISGIIMYVMLRSLGEYLGSSIITTIIQVSTGCLLYFGMVILFELLTKDKFILEELEKLKGVTRGHCSTKKSHNDML